MTGWVRALKMTNTGNFPSKLLIFGEYSVLAGSDAFILPYPAFHGNLDFYYKNISEYQRRSHLRLRGLLDYCLSGKKEMTDWFDLDRFSNDMEGGMYFHSNIPEKYGIGSSGALIAAIYKSYGEETKNIQLLRSRLALLESFFHSNSSGIDPLCSFLNKPLHVRSEEISKLKIDINKIAGGLYLYDSGTRAPTGNLVNSFLERMKESSFNASVTNKYVLLVNRCIESFINLRKEDYISAFSEISAFQLDHFGDYIPRNVQSIWERGLKRGDYFMKLCGSGGGGYFYLFSSLKMQLLHQAINTRKLTSVTTL